MPKMACVRCAKISWCGEERCPLDPLRRLRSRSPGRDGAAQARFRCAVLQRDGNRCTRCGISSPTGRGLVAHHVLSLARGGSYHPDNGVTLCDHTLNNCHHAVDRYA